MKNLSLLAGEQDAEQQIPLTLISVDIPSPYGPWSFCDLDQPVYLDELTGEASLVPFTAARTFSPYADFAPPDISQSSDATLPEVEFSVSNADQSWYAVIASGVYRGAAVRVWQVQAVLAPGEPPDSATLTSAVEAYNGELDVIEATHTAAVLRAVPPTADFVQRLPRLIFNKVDFPLVPNEGQTLRWGSTERDL